MHFLPISHQKVERLDLLCNISRDDRSKVWWPQGWESPPTNDLHFAHQIAWHSAVASSRSSLVLPMGICVIDKRKTSLWMVIAETYTSPKTQCVIPSRPPNPVSHFILLDWLNALRKALSGSIIVFVSRIYTFTGERGARIYSNTEQGPMLWCRHQNESVFSENVWIFWFAPSSFARGNQNTRTQTGDSIGPPKSRLDMRTGQNHEKL